MAAALVLVVTEALVRLTERSRLEDLRLGREGHPREIDRRRGPLGYAFHVKTDP
jgi:hypothetical protein